MENFALDLAYVRTLKHVSKAVAFSPKVCEISYLHSKSCANANIQDNQRRSYRVREEHCISLIAAEEIVGQWRQWQQEEQQREESVEEDLYGLEDEGDVEEDLYRIEDEGDVVVAVDVQDQQLQGPLPQPLLLPYYIFSSLDMFAFLTTSAK